MAGGADPFLETAAVFLGAAVVAVPLAQRLRMGSVIGYLAAGAAIGPYGIAFIQNPETVLSIAEFGVVLLLFIIGLELKLSRLWRLRRDIFGLGVAQVTGTGALLALVFTAFGFGPATAVVAGAALALSSTAMGVQMMRERREMATPHGDRAFSILLCQDLAIVPLFALVAFLAPSAAPDQDPWISAILAILAVIALIIAVRFLLGPIFQLIAQFGNHEVFGAASLLVVLVSALAMDMVGLSMALGAFIAGVLLAESEFRHQLETDIEPFRGLLLGSFFMGFGMTLDWGLVLSSWAIVIGGAVGLFAGKAAILYGLTRAFGSSHADGLRIASTLGQGGEFAFVMITLAVTAGLFEGALPAILSAIVTLSMILTPLAMNAVDRMIEGDPDDDPSEMPGVEEAGKARVIVAGFGRVGQVIARILSARDYDVTLIDNSPRRIRIARTFGSDVYFGDARRLDVLETAGAAEADLLFLCINDREGAPESVAKLKEKFPDLKIFAETYDRFSEMEMRRAGVDFVIRQTYETAIALASEGLRSLGDAGVVEEVVDEFHDIELLELQTKYGAEQGAAMQRDRYQLADQK
ncbi:MAG: monovalent cation:proton antiporter-2 (CPA2) family protein [Rubricella sp.]